jgi:hypothetical protein
LETQTAAGSISLRGSGMVVATPADARMLAEWGRAVYEEALSGRGGAAWGLAFTWQRVGGIAGFCDEVGVYLSGEAQVSSCQASAPPARLQLDALQLDRLYTLVDTLAPFEVTQGEAATADGLTISLAFSGQGSGEAQPADQQFLLDLGSELAIQAWTPPDPGGQALALRALEDYLGALARADYAGAAALYGGSYETFSNNNPGIPPEDRAALFEAACMVNGYVCNLSVRSVAHSAGLGPGLFRFVVELQNPEGALFELGPCCGEAPIDAPPQTQFAFLVQRVETAYLVLTEPVYIP